MTQVFVSFRWCLDMDLPPLPRLFDGSTFIEPMFSRTLGGSTVDLPVLNE
jgi:hypothetical protein